MRVCETIRPGEGGSKRYLERYGDRLVCVRYRHDPVANRRLTTVELIVDERPSPPDPTELLLVRVRLDEPVLRSRVKQAGGIWNSRQRLWELTRAAVDALELHDRVAAGVPRYRDGAPTSAKKSPHVPNFKAPARST